MKLVRRVWMKGCGRTILLKCYNKVKKTKKGKGAEV